MRFDTLGRLTDFSMDALEALVESGNRFRLPAVLDVINDISACNRPYGDSMPMNIRLSPLALNARDVTLVCRQVRKDEVGA